MTNLKVLLFFGVVCIGSSAHASCELVVVDMPTFSLPSVVVPTYEGRDCSLQGWLQYHRNLAGTVTQQIAAYDSARLEHDVRIRAFDRKLERSKAAGKCVGQSYNNLHDEIELQNDLNSGPRLANWRTAQAALARALKRSSSNISRLNVDRGSNCDGDEG